MRTCHIQIENGEPFLPEEVRAVGFEMGLKETTKDSDEVRNYKIISRVAKLDYTYQDRAFSAFFKSGEWAKTPGGAPLFIAREMLEFRP